MDSSIIYAAKYGDLEFLQEVGTQIEMIFLKKTKEGRNLIHIAAQYDENNFEFIKSCLEISYPKYYKSLLTQGAWDDGNTPFHEAARVGDLRIVELMYGYLQKIKGGEAEKPWLVQNKDGDTAVHLAIGSQKFKVARFLLDMDLDFAFVFNTSEEAPLHVAVKNYECEKSSIVEKLLMKRAESTFIESADDKESMTSIIVLLVETAKSMATLPDIEGLTPLDRVASLHSPDNIMFTQFITEHCTQSIEVCDKKKDGKEPDALQVWLDTHQPKKGSHLDKASDATKKSIEEDLARLPLDSCNEEERMKIYQKHVGEDKNGYAKTYGLGVKVPRSRAKRCALEAERAKRIKSEKKVDNLEMKLNKVTNIMKKFLQLQGISDDLSFSDDDGAEEDGEENGEENLQDENDMGNGSDEDNESYRLEYEDRHYEDEQMM